MSTKTFFTALSSVINAAEVASKGGLSYLAAAVAMRLAGRPEVTFVDFGGKPHLECLNGALVAVDLAIPGTEKIQRMWLPVMDQANQPLSKIQATDINNSRQRCLVKAIAAVYGDGLSLYMNCAGDGPKAAKILGVTPDSDLATVPPVIATLKEGGAPYIEWNIGLAACRITDPTFSWNVVMWENADGQLLPFRHVLGSLMVDVETEYRGKRQRLSLPVMDSSHNPVPAAKATVFDWNKAVMRALTKCIAFNTGYGIGVYADEFGSDTTGKGSKGGKGAKADAKPAEKPAETPAAEPATVAQAVAEPATVAEPDDNEAEIIASNSESDDACAEVAAAEATYAAEAAETQVSAASAVTESAQVADAPVAELVADSVPTETPSNIANAVERFRGVMKGRKDSRGVEGVISVFESLAVSTKFTADEKPACFAVLVPAATALVTTETINYLVAQIEKYDAMQYLAHDARAMVASKLCAVFMAAACAKGNDELLKSPTVLMSAGIAPDYDESLKLAAAGGLAKETIELLNDLVEQDIAEATN